MMNLALTVLGILVACVAATIGLSYINSDHFIEIDAGQIASTNRFAIREAFTAYKTANRGALPSLPQGQDAFPAADLKPYLATPPQTRYGLTWSYLADGSGRYWACLSATSVAKPVFDGLVSVEALDDRTIVAGTCLDTEADHAFQGEAAFKFEVD